MESPERVSRMLALHLDRYRTTIDAEVDRRLGRAEPAPAARVEVVRRFRSFCRLASIDIGLARPSLDGLAGASADGLENAIRIATDIALQCGLEGKDREQLETLAARFRAGIRRVMRPEESAPRAKRRAKRVNAGKRVRAAIDRINDAYVALCLETGRIHDLNPAAETLLGSEANSLIDCEFRDWIDPGDRLLFESLESRLDAGEESAPTTLRFRRASGESIPTEVSVAHHTIGARRLAILVARERA